MKFKWLYLSVVVVILLTAPKAGEVVADLFGPYYPGTGSGGNFMWGIVHHIVQAVIPVLVVLIWKKELFQYWGFKLGNKSLGFKWIGWFSLVWILIYVGLTSVNLLLDNSPEAYYDVTRLGNLFGELFFRGVIVGPCEEVLFRSFPISLLLFASFDKPRDIFGFEVTQAGLISAVLFALAHIGFSFFPLEVYHFNIVQLITCLGFGILYAIVFHQTKSIYYPMIIHAISDVIPVLSLYVIKL